MTSCEYINPKFKAKMFECVLNRQCTYSMVADNRNIPLQCSNCYFGIDLLFIIVEDERRVLPAHRRIVQKASPVLECIVNGSGMLRGAKKHDGYYNIEVHDIELEAFLEILRFIYCRYACLYVRTVCQVFFKADYYGLTDLQEACSAPIHQTIIASADHVFEFYIYIFGESRYERIIKYCLRHIRYDVYRVAFDRDDLMAIISPDALRAILSSDRINCSETILFDALINWATLRVEQQDQGLNVNTDVSQTNYQRIRQLCVGLESCIRWSTMLDSELRWCSRRAPFFFNAAETRELFRNRSSATPRRQWLTVRYPKWQNGFRKVHPSCLTVLWRNKNTPLHLLIVLHANTYTVMPFVQNAEFSPVIQNHLWQIIGTGYRWQQINPLTDDIPPGCVIMPLQENRSLQYIVRIDGVHAALFEWYTDRCLMSTSSAFEPSNSTRKFEVLVDLNHDDEVWPPNKKVAVQLQCTQPDDSSVFWLGRAVFASSDIVPCAVDVQLGRAYDLRFARSPEHTTTIYELLKIRQKDIMWDEPFGIAYFIKYLVVVGRTAEGAQMFLGRPSRLTNKRPRRTTGISDWTIGVVVQDSYKITLNGETQDLLNYEIMVFREETQYNEFMEMHWQTSDLRPIMTRS